MTHHWDELSKSLAEEALPRRESLRRIGAALAGVVLSPLGLQTALAGGKGPCKTYCRCRNKQQQNACLAACRACNQDTSRLCGSCSGGFVCTDLGNDVFNCGACGNVCWPGPFEDSACVDGECVYACVQGAADCGDGRCTPLWADPDNCGACGTVCGAGATCQNSTCQPNTCVPNCPTNWCGGDGCGGECACPPDSFCMGDGLNMCVPCNGACP